MSSFKEYIGVTEEIQEPILNEDDMAKYRTGIIKDAIKAAQKDGNDFVTVKFGSTKNINIPIKALESLIKAL